MTLALPLSQHSITSFEKGPTFDHPLSQHSITSFIKNLLLTTHCLSIVIQVLTKVPKIDDSWAAIPIIMVRSGVSAGSAGYTIAIGSGSDHPSTRAGRRIARVAQGKLPQTTTTHLSHLPKGLIQLLFGTRVLAITINLTITNTSTTHQY